MLKESFRQKKNDNQMKNGMKGMKSTRNGNCVGR